MKKLLLTACFLALAAGAAMAGDPTNFQTLKPDPVTTPTPINDISVRTDTPAVPVPEPGTMALASMGLIALGAAARGRSNKR